MLVGRDDELGRAEKLLTASRAGEGGVLVVRGDPGIGKSALLRAVVGRAADAGMRLLLCRGSETFAADTFAGLSELFMPIADGADELPAFPRDALRGALGYGRAKPADRRTIWAAALSLVDIASADTPLAIVIDDAHRLDTPSLEAMAFVAHRLNTNPSRIALIAATRDAPDNPFVAAHFPTLRLGPLPAPAARRLVDGAANLEAGDRDRILQLAEGNPLALLELPSHLAASPPRITSTVVGDLVARLFRSRVGELSAGARLGLVIAALCDDAQVSTVTRAGELVGLPARALAEGIEAGLVSSHAGVLSFRHPLVREAVIAGADAHSRRRAHEALAQVLADASPERSAWHRAAEIDLPDEALAAALAAAAEHAAGRSSYATASRAFARAAELSEDPALVARRLHDAARAALAAGQLDEAAQLVARALPTTQDQGLRVDLLQTQGVVLSLAERPPEALATFLAAADDVEHDDPRRAAALLADAVIAALQLGRAADARALALRAERLAGSAPSHQRDAARLAVSITGVLAGGGAPAMRADEMTRMLDGDPSPLTTMALVVGAATFLWAEDFDRFDRVIGAVIARGRNVSPADLTLALVYRGKRGFRAGHTFAAAAADLTEAADLAESFGQRTVVCFALAHHCLVEAARGNTQACRPMMQRAEAIIADTGLGSAAVHLRSAAGLLALSTGNAEEAVAILEDLDALCTQFGIEEPNLLWYRANLSEALFAVGRIPDARQVAEKLFSDGARSDRAWPRAAASRCRGIAAADPRAAVAHLREALVWHLRSRTPFEEARTRLALGEALARTGESDDAARELTTAAEAFARFGAVGWVRRAEAAGATDPLPKRVTLAVDHLSAREFQVASMAVNGLTNREIASSMSISARTVEHHLAHVYEKLGLRNRTELAGRLGTTIQG